MYRNSDKTDIITIYWGIHFYPGI